MSDDRTTDPSPTGDAAAHPTPPPPAPPVGGPSAPAPTAPPTPPYDSAGATAPAYSPPAYGAPAYGAPAYEAPAYGAPTYGAPAYGAAGYAVSARTNTLAILSLVASLAGVFVLPFVGQIAGIVLGHVSLSQLKERAEKGRGMAIAGLIVGYATLALGVLLIFAFFLIVQAAVGESGTRYGA